MLELLKKNKIILAVVAILIVLFVWFGMRGGGNETALLTSDATGGAPGSTQTAQQRAMLDILFQLKAIQLAGTIFNDPAFRALRDFRTEIVAEPIGRKNPFAPLGADAATAVGAPPAGEKAH